MLTTIENTNVKKQATRKKTARESEIRASQDRNFNEEVGIRVEIKENSNCLQHFELLFTNDVYRLILNEAILELKAWLGLTLNVGLVRKKSIKSSWSKNSVIQIPIFPNTTSRDCYLHILRFLHFTDNDNAPARTDPNRDKLWKIKPFLNALLPRLTAVYAPSQNLSLGETKFKGRVHFRQFLTLKQSSFRLKGFVIADASTGYVLNTSIYTGKEGPAASEDLAMHIVLNLTEPYAHKG